MHPALSESPRTSWRSMRYPFSLAPLAFVLISIQPVHAQALPDSGARVRIASPQLTQGRLVGVLQRTTADSVIVSGHPISRASITRIDVSTGRKSKLLVGMGIGGVVGAVGGVALAVIDTGANGETCNVDGVEVCSIGGLFGAGAGALLGAVTGALVRSDVWSTIPLTAIRIAPILRSDGAVGVSLRFRF